MQFYCPVCQKTMEATEERSMVTKLNQPVHFAHCPTCQQEMVVYGGGAGPVAPTEAAPVPAPTVAESVAPMADPAAAPNTEQAQVDQALKDFGSVV